MKKDLLKGAAICITVLMVVNSASLTYAVDKVETRGIDENKTHVVAWEEARSNIGKKLYRGLANIVTCWGEIPKGVSDTTKEFNTLSGCTLGLIKGTGLTVARCAVGVYETVTFLLPIPEGYSPIVEPEFIFGKNNE